MTTEQYQIGYEAGYQVGFDEALAQQDQPDQQLCRFYGVGTYPELVAALEQHILRLQARLKTPLNPFHPINPRQG